MKMKKIVFAASLTALSLHASAQTPSLLIPEGTSGIGNNSPGTNIKFNTSIEAAANLDWSVYNDSRNRFKVNYNSFGNVEIGEVFRIKHNFGTLENYIDIGSQSSDFMHIYSNASFIFNQPIFTTSGVFSGYSNGDLSFKTASATRLTISGTTGNIGIGTTAPISNLQIGEATTNGLVNLGGYANIGSLRSSGDLFIGNRVYAKYNSATENSVIRATQNATLGFSTAHFTELGDIKFYAHTGVVTTDTKVNIADYNVFNIMGNGNVYAKGKVGIGTENPMTSLELNNGTLMLSGESSLGQIAAYGARFVINTGTSYEHKFLEFKNSNGIQMSVESDGSIGAKRLQITHSSNTTYAATLINGGGSGSGLLIKCGAGSNGGNYYLMRAQEYDGDDVFAVNGKTGITYARAIEVTMNNFPDYVFANDYNLKSLQEVEEYIKVNKHLPNVPSANEIETNGANLGELVKIQMEKIEELTLYIIQQQKEIDALKAK